MKIIFSLIGLCARQGLALALMLPAVLCGQLQAQPADSFHWSAYDESAELEALSSHDNVRMRFKLINSRYLDKNALWGPFAPALTDFSARYEELKPLVLEQDIPALQRAIREGRLSYEELTTFYLFRIRMIESDNSRSLNALIATNPQAIAAARGKDRAREAGLVIDEQSLFGIPVLLKDNIGTVGMKTTAGAQILAGNDAHDAFVTRRLKANGAVILGKANLSEWAYYFCDGCPLGYSAMGGQTLNPYGRMVLETGGSSSGSAVAVAANLTAVAVGSETSGSILSPASHNSAVGLKPTTGMLSRSGVVPISGSLDTLGPIARSVTDAVILFNAMSGYDSQDMAMPLISADAHLTLREAALAGKRLGVIAGLDTEPLVREAIGLLRAAGAEVLEIALPELEMPEFGTFLGAEMKRDLGIYLSNAADPDVGVSRVEEIIMYNSAELESRAPYGQGRFDAMADMAFSEAQIEQMRVAIRGAGNEVLGSVMNEQRLDALISVNNSHASVAAAANFPALTVPLGLRAEDGDPVGLTLIAPSYNEQTLVDIGLALERLHKGRTAPANYQ